LPPAREALAPVPDFTAWVQQVRTHVQAHSPELTSLFELFANEALFGRRWLQSALDELPAGANILEVGGGLTLTGCQLAREGYQVTVIEPISKGFSSFSRLQALVLECASAQGIGINLLPIGIEELDTRDSFDLAFSVNVMEHVANVDTAIVRVVGSLKSYGFYRFTCPNYLFPYEPHFNIPTLLSKPLTERVFHKQIFGSTRVKEPRPIWETLNWIDVRQVRRVCARLANVNVTFTRDMTANSVERMITDKAFASRRAAWMNALARWVVATRLHRLSALLPASMLPMIDCTIRIAPPQTESP
jgi:SAM-dependent methyltransferase